MEKKTALYDTHVAAGGKMVPFAGYLLPVQYPAGLIKEHAAVRTSCGLFDVSHMGEIFFTGTGALDALNYLMTNDFSDMPIGRCRYTALCYEDGGVVDDLIIYRLAEDRFLAIVNASNKDKDFAWIKDQVNKANNARIREETEIQDRSDDYAQLALQGPRATEILSQLTSPDALPEKYYTFFENVIVAGVSCLVSRTGYTGEDGFELYFPANKAPELWNALLAAGEDFGLLPCGLGARDTLRFEASMPLYGHEMDGTINPFEAGISFAVKLSKDDFVGKSALEANREPTRHRIGLEVIGRGIVREHAPVFFKGEQIGMTTSGTFCPTLQKACAMALVTTDSVSLGDEVEAEVRGKMIPARVVTMPFYKKA